MSWAEFSRVYWICHRLSLGVSNEYDDSMLVLQRPWMFRHDKTQYLCHGAGPPYALIRETVSPRKGPVMSVFSVQARLQFTAQSSFSSFVTLMRVK